LKKSTSKTPKIKPELIAEPLSNACKERYECQMCGLYKHNKHPFIEPKVPKHWDRFGLFISQAPEKKEDKKGSLNLGPTAKLLKLIRKLASYKKRHFAFLTAVRCRVPGDGIPTSAQIRFCRPFLLQAIKDLKPKNIVLLGRVAITTAWNKTGMSVISARGRDLIIEGSALKNTKIIATYDPASILGNRGNSVHLRDVIKNDLKSLKRTRVFYPKEQCPSGKIIAYDTEYAPDKTLLTEGIANEKQAVAWDLTSGPGWGDRGTIKRAKILVGHNLPGDLDYLVKNKLAKNTWLKGDDIKDSLLLARLHDENKQKGGYSLENLMLSEFKVKPWKEPTASMFKKNPDASLWPVKERKERCRLDAWASIKLAQLYGDDREDLSKISHRIEMTLYRVGLAGAAVLNRRFMRLGNSWTTEVAHYGDLVTRAAHKNKMPDFVPTNKDDIRKLLFKRLGLPKQGYTKKARKLLVDKKVLKVLIDLADSSFSRKIVKNVLSFGTYHKLASTWFGGGKGKRKSIKELLVPFPTETVYANRKRDGKLSLLHNWINPLGAKTGRRSGGGTDPEIALGLGRNPQNWPPLARVVIVSRWHGQGGRIAAKDYNKLEPLMMAWKIQMGTNRESRLLYYFGGGGSGYIGLAKDLLHWEVKDGSLQYKAIKSIYLGIGYGMSVWKLAHDLKDKAGMELSHDWDKHLKKTGKIMKKYFRMFPEVKEYHHRQEKELLRNQRALGELRMIRHLPHLGPDMEGFKHLLNQAYNLPIQYLASLVTGSAMIDYEAALLKAHGLTYVDWHEALLDDPYNLPCSPLINEVHDELNQDMHPKTGTKDLKILDDAMLGVPTLRRMLPEFKVKLSVSTKVGETWT